MCGMTIITTHTNSSLGRLDSLMIYLHLKVSKCVVHEYPLSFVFECSEVLLATSHVQACTRGLLPLCVNIHVDVHW